MITDQAFVLHKRNYQDSSQLIKLITMNHGIIDVVAKGCLRPKSKLNGQLQPFIQTQVNLYGRSDLKTLADADQSGVNHSGNSQSHGYKNQVSMLYCNELLTLINLGEHADAAVFNAYKNTIKELQTSSMIRITLRRFEWHLCCQMGYELQVPEHTEPDDYLAFDPINGLIVNNTDKRTKCSVQAFNNFVSATTINQEQLNEISVLMRVVINHLVNGKAIKSRQLLSFK